MHLRFFRREIPVRSSVSHGSSRVAHRFSPKQTPRLIRFETRHRFLILLRLRRRAVYLNCSNANGLRLKHFDFALCRLFYGRITRSLSNRSLPDYAKKHGFPEPVSLILVHGGRDILCGPDRLSMILLIGSAIYRRG